MEEKQDRLQDGFMKKADMPFLHHLEELRHRLLKSLFAVIVMAGGAFYFSDHLLVLIRIPLGDIDLYNIEVTGAFYAYLKISLIAGFIASAPIVFYQMWKFIAPGLYSKEKFAILPIVFVSSVLFAVGAVFCFYTVLPLSFKFLIGFSGEMIQNTITIGSYINFVGLLLMAFGFGFQLPLMNYFLGKIGMIDASFLSKGRRYAIVIILIFGAVITPPDVFTQVLLAIPLYILYEISIAVVYFTSAKDKKKRE